MRNCSVPLTSRSSQLAVLSVQKLLVPFDWSSWPGDTEVWLASIRPTRACSKKGRPVVRFAVDTVDGVRSHGRPCGIRSYEIMQGCTFKTPPMPLSDVGLAPFESLEHMSWARASWYIYETDLGNTFAPFNADPLDPATADKSLKGNFTTCFSPNDVLFAVQPVSEEQALLGQLRHSRTKPTQLTLMKRDKPTQHTTWADVVREKPPTQPTTREKKTTERHQFANHQPPAWQQQAVEQDFVSGPTDVPPSWSTVYAAVPTVAEMEDQSGVVAGPSVIIPLEINFWS